MAVDTRLLTVTLSLLPDDLLPSLDYLISNLTTLTAEIGIHSLNCALEVLAVPVLVTDFDCTTMLVSLSIAQTGNWSDTERTVTIMLTDVLKVITGESLTGIVLNSTVGRGGTGNRVIRPSPSRTVFRALVDKSQSVLNVFNRGRSKSMSLSIQANTGLWLVAPRSSILLTAQLDVVLDDDMLWH